MYIVIETFQDPTICRNEDGSTIYFEDQADAYDFARNECQDGKVVNLKSTGKIKSDKFRAYQIISDWLSPREDIPDYILINLKSDYENASGAVDFIEYAISNLYGAIGYKLFFEFCSWLRGSKINEFVDVNKLIF